MFGKTQQTTTALKDAEKLYVQSIMRIRQEMQDPSDEAIDYLLLSIMLMGFYEVLFDLRVTQHVLTKLRMSCIQTTKLTENFDPTCRPRRPAHGSSRQFVTTRARWEY